MKKKLRKFLCILCVLSAFSAQAVFGGSCGLYINNAPVSGSAVIINGVSLVPAEFAALYFSAQIDYDPAAQTAVLSKDGVSCTVKAGSSSITASNGKSYEYAAAAVMENGRLYMPARGLISCFGGSILWDDTSKTVFINSETEYAREQTRHIASALAEADSFVGNGMYYEALAALDKINTNYASSAQAEQTASLRARAEKALNDYRGMALKDTAENIFYGAKVLASGGDFYGGARRLEELRLLGLSQEYMPEGYELWNRFINANIHLMQAGQKNQIETAAMLLSEAEALCGRGLYYEALAKLEYIDKTCYVNLQHRSISNRLKTAAEKGIAAL